ncbi:MAG: hypothetical protein ACKVU4_10095 [Phycisphaerales bacterium]
MPETTHPSQDTEKLDSRVSALLDQMQQASDRVLKELDSADASAAAPIAGDGLGAAVDQMIGQARSAVRDPAGVPPASAGGVEEVPGEIESLDQHLAGTGDAMIDGEIADEAAVLAAAAAVAPAVAVAPPLPAPAAMPPAAPTPRDSVSSAPAAPSVPGAPATRPAEPARAKPAPNPAAKAGVPPTARPGVVARVLRPAWAAFGPRLIDAGEAVSSFVPANPPAYRRLMGYLALVGVFNAACLLTYNFAFREPATPAPAAEHGAEASDGHGAAKDAHGAEPKTDGHGAEPKKDDHGAPGKDDAKKKSTAKKPKTRSTLPKDKKGGGHGGGH